MTIFERIFRAFRPAAPDLVETATRLTKAVDGIDWDAAEVEACCRGLIQEAKKSRPEQLAAALAVLVARLERARVEDADGVAHVAMSAGALVENGAPPLPLGEVLLEKVPALLAAARAYADRCLASMGEHTAEDEDEDPPEDDVIAYVDDRYILRDVFREHLAGNRGAGAALAHLVQWTLPTVAALTRDRALLIRATRDTGFCAAAEALAHSEASWLHVLTGVQLDAPWLALFPALGRGFRLTVDGVTSNFDLHALLADVLVERGVPATRNPPDVIAVIRGQRERASQEHVTGSWNLYSFGAALHDVGAPRDVPHEHWVWGEGQPRDVPAIDGVRTLVVGPAAYERTWTAGSTFCALRPRIEVTEELAPAAVKDGLEGLAAAARTRPA